MFSWFSSVSSAQYLKSGHRQFILRLYNAFNNQCHRIVCVIVHKITNVNERIIFKETQPSEHCSGPRLITCPPDFSLFCQASEILRHFSLAQIVHTVSNDGRIRKSEEAVLVQPKACSRHLPKIVEENHEHSQLR